MLTRRVSAGFVRETLFLACASGCQNEPKSKFLPNSSIVANNGGLFHGAVSFEQAIQDLPPDVASGVGLPAGELNTELCKLLIYKEAASSNGTASGVVLSIRSFRQFT